MFWVVLAPLSACSAAPAVPAPASTANTASAAAASYGQFAAAGKTLFTGHCAKCHGDNGQGVTAPAIIGAGSNLAKYNTARGLLNFIEVAMPFDAPGSLSQQDYLNLMAFLLVQNNYLAAATPFDTGQLNGVQLTK